MLHEEDWFINVQGHRAKLFKNTEHGTVSFCPVQNKCFIKGALVICTPPTPEAIQELETTISLLKPPPLEKNDQNQWTIATKPFLVFDEKLGHIVNSNTQKPLHGFNLKHLLPSTSEMFII
jgi:hypothetical protein